MGWTVCYRRPKEELLMVSEITEGFLEEGLGPNIQR